MATTTTRLGLRKPEPTDAVDVVADLADVYDDIDTKLGGGADLALDEDKRLVVGGSASASSVAVTRGLAGDGVVTSRVGADTASRFVLTADGKMSWGPGGAAAQDVSLYRSQADFLKTDDAFWSVGAVFLGTDGSANIYRSAANVLKTDDTFNAVIDSQVNGVSLPRGIVGRHVRTTNGTATSATTAATAQPYMRITGIPILANRLYRIAAYNLGVFGSGYGRAQAGIYITTNNTTPTTSSSVIKQAAMEMSNTGFVESLSMEAHYSPAANQTLGVLLAYWYVDPPPAGVITVTGYAAADWPVDLVVEDLGVDPGATGTNL